MVYRPEEVVNKVQRLLSDVETEVVEYKSAKNNFDFDDLGKYFSALSNEANLRHADAGWLLFGVRNDRTICGTGYRKEAHEPSVGLRKLKHEVALYTNSGMTFEEIYELTIERQRVVVFQIPPASFATPTTWKGVPYSRENESIVQMPAFKLTAIYSQARPDWSSQLAYDANVGDLDSDAVAFACEEYSKKYAPRQRAIEGFSSEEILTKIGLLIHGHVTMPLWCCLVSLSPRFSLVESSRASLGRCITRRMMWSHMSISSPRSYCRWTRCLARFATRNTGFSRIQIRCSPR